MVVRQIVLPVYRLFLKGEPMQVMAGESRAITYLTTDELSRRIKYDARTIRDRLKDSVLFKKRKGDRQQKLSHQGVDPLVEISGTAVSQGLSDEAYHCDVVAGSWRSTGMDCTTTWAYDNRNALSRLQPLCPEFDQTRRLGYGQVASSAHVDCTH